MSQINGCLYDRLHSGSHVQEGGWILRGFSENAQQHLVIFLFFFLNVIIGVRMDSPLHSITWHCVLYVDSKRFSDWPSRLTAFIAKELSNSRDIIDVTDSYIQEAVSYLISKQKADGAWDDPNPLYDRGMKVEAAQRIKPITSQQCSLYSLQ